jgi:hypothetical integral membrane protein (TIGR02206 family)
MLLDVIIQTGSQLWYAMTIATTAGIVSFVMVPKYFPSTTNMIRIFLGSLFLATAIAIHPYLFYLGHWKLQSSLPLQLCSLSGLLSGIVLLFPSQLGYELLMYWGIPGAFHSLLTPEMTQGEGTYFLMDYYVSHGGIILSALFLTYSWKMELRKNSWLKIFLFSQILIPLVGLVDYLLDANYMYLKSKPDVDNPLIMGRWPWYIAGFEIFLLVHMYIIYFIFYVLRKKKVKSE